MTELHDNIEKVEPSKLIPYNNNPKSHPEEQVDKIASSIKSYGFVQPIVTDKDNEVIIGHGRLQAAKKLGLEKVPVIKHENLSESEIKALRLADNRIAETDWEDEKLAVELEQLTEADEYEELIHGFNEDELSEYLDTLTDEEDLEEPETEDPEQLETDVTEGEVFKLGKHRLMCGDATNEEHVETLMNGQKADMVFTDPPYGINVVEESGVLQGEGSSKNSGKIGASNKAKAKEYMPVAGDDSTDASKKHINLIRDYCGEMIIWGGNYFTDFLKPSRGWIIWNKKNGDTSFADVEMAWTSYDISARMFDWQWSGMIREGNQEVEGAERSHPTQKPVGLTAKIINSYCPDQIDTVIDCFAGSGTTLLAAEQTNRKAFCMELDPQYCQVIINRWEELTGKEHEVLT